MGLLSTLAGLPLAPMKGLVGMARFIQQQAQREQAAELSQLQAELLELQLLHDDFEEDELIRKENELLEKMGALVGASAVALPKQSEIEKVEALVGVSVNGG